MNFAALVFYKCHILKGNNKMCHSEHVCGLAHSPDPMCDLEHYKTQENNPKLQVVNITLCESGKRKPVNGEQRQSIKDHWWKAGNKK